MYYLPHTAIGQLDTIYNMDALDLMRALPDASIDLIATDPPYFAVKDEAWDNQWPDAASFLAWLETHLKEMRRVLKPNGSLYLFASPRMGSRVEVLIEQYFNVINRITWKKQAQSYAEIYGVENFRSYVSMSEVIIFAEQWGGDKSASGEAGYHEVYDEAKRQLKYTILAEYLDSEFQRAGVSRRDIAALFPSHTGNLTGCVSNWLLGYNLPTGAQYQTMRLYLNNRAGGEFLRREYEDLRREYEDLRREYEDLRRPFNISAADQYTDVWTFRTVNTYEGKHPTEKPLNLMSQIIRVSSKPGAVVLDPFCGSGTTLDAARQLGRRYIGGDSDPHWAQYAGRRVTKPFTLSMLELLDEAS